MPPKVKQQHTNYCPKHFLLSTKCRDKDCKHWKLFKVFPISGNMALSKIYRLFPNFSPYRQQIRDNIDEVLDRTGIDGLDQAYVEILDNAEEQKRLFSLEPSSNKRKSKSPPRTDKRIKVDETIAIKNSAPEEDSSIEEDCEKLSYIIDRQNVIDSSEVPINSILRTSKLVNGSSDQHNIDNGDIPYPPDVTTHIVQMYTSSIQTMHTRWIIHANKLGIISDANCEDLQLLVFDNQCALASLTLFLSLYDTLCSDDVEDAKKRWSVEGSMLLGEILEMMSRRASTKDAATVSTNKRKVLPLSIDSSTDNVQSDEN
ncbi:cysA1 [Acrasis kona]|uniref:CysA1 n=1 Tax=Acrasis kona TaxID=1008807 RepID=A0AAW2Z582_9EUKA